MQQFENHTFPIKTSEGSEVESNDSVALEATITEDRNNLFAVNFREQALKDGTLVDVSKMAHEAGFIYPVAVTKSVWDDVHAIPVAHGHEDVEGRLWDVLFMAHVAVRQSPRSAAHIRYNLILHVDDTEMYQVKLGCKPGDSLEPVITLSNPQKDIDLPLGRIVITEGAMDALLTAKASAAAYITRHQSGDWGELDEDDRASNNRAVLLEDDRILSAYTLTETSQKLWVITEWDRSATTMLLPSEY